MYKILLVDDEPIIREGISRNMKWEQLGLEVIGACEHGLEALDIVKNNAPDILLTDICMPFMDGIELADHILEMYPNTKVVVLTGHEKFEYVQQAIKLKVNDFLLKPIMPKELHKILSKVVKELDEEHVRLDNIKKLEVEIENAYPIRQERFLNRLISKCMKQETYLQKTKMLDIHFHEDHLLTCIIEPVNEALDHETMLLGIKHICESVLTEVSGAYVFDRNSERVITIISSEHYHNIYEITHLASEKIVDLCKKHLGIDVKVGIGSVVNTPRLLTASYEEAKKALDYRFIYNKSIIDIQDVYDSTNVDKKYYRTMAKKLQEVMRTGSKQEVDYIIDQLFMSLPNFCNELEDYYMNIQNCLLSILNMMEDHEISYEDVFTDKSPFEMIHDHKTLEDLKEWLRSIAHCVLEVQKDNQMDFQAKQIIKAKSYIKKHYAESDLSLKQICKAVCMSTSYFSSLFKEKYDMTFIEFLTEYRIVKAKEYMKSTNLRNYEIAEKIGYNDPHYFSLLFKKTTGMTPTEFRSTINGE